MINYYGPRNNRFKNKRMKMLPQWYLSIPDYQVRDGVIFPMLDQYQITNDSGSFGRKVTNLEINPGTYRTADY